MSNVKHDVIITGVPPVPGDSKPTPYPRRPIEELVKDPKQFSLYVQAMDLMMKEDWTKQVSWFAVGGIHGAPRMPWDHVAGLANPSWGGYCTHASILFPTWHRPYVLLFEQALVQYAVRVAGDYKGADAANWLRAAQTLRSPYWDWAINSQLPAEVVESATLKITKATGIATIPNPLLTYTFRSGEPPADPRNRPHTVRCPTSARPNETNLPSLRRSLQVLDNPNDPMRDRVYNTLHDASTWELFSNKRTSQGAFRNSLESIHDMIHVLVGGAGQMGDPAVAAFDPIFWLHHTNVDRLLSLWQALHPNVWVSPVTGNGEGGTFTMPRNARVNQDTDLTPFWNGQSTFFKSSSQGVRQWEKSNYTYPEFQFLNMADAAQVRTAIDAKVRDLYATEETSLKSLAATPASAAPKSSDGSELNIGARITAPVRAFAEQAVLAVAPNASNHAPRTDWFVRIRSKPASVGQSFTVLFFLGEPPAQEHDFRTAPNLLGLHFEFVNSEQGECANCLMNADMVTEGFVELTRAVKAHGLYDKPEEEIERYLKDNLMWRIQKIDAEVIQPSAVAGLEIAVMTVPLEFVEDRHRWGKPEDVRPRHRNLAFRLPGGRALPQ